MEYLVNLSPLESALELSWSKDTSVDPDRWNEQNPTWGQCAVTALVVQDLFGGEILRLDTSKHKDPNVAVGRSHYFNRIADSSEVDFTASQFIDQQEFLRIKNTQEPMVRTREYLLGNESTKNRYISLRMKVAKHLSGNHFLFYDYTYRRCLSLALQSNCRKGKYGCVILNRFDASVVTEAYNKVLEPLKDWCEPECIRMKIPSRTESMIGCCGHAEELALAEARDAGVYPQNCAFYVAGFRSNGLAYIKPEADFTCLRCATQLYIQKVDSVYVPTLNGWARLSTEEAVRTAKLFATQEKRM